MDPIEQLKLEHENILRGVNYLNKTGEIAEKGELPANEAKLLIQFFQGYADAGHHAKEEEIFFKKLYEKNPDINQENTPVGVLLQQHVEGRSLIKDISQLDEGYADHVKIYSDLLNRHIEIEDNIFPVLVEDYLSEPDVQMMSVQFNQVDAVRDINQYLKILDTVSNSL